MSHRAGTVAPMDITVVNWNVNGWHTITNEQVALLERLDWDVLTLQELTPRSYDRLVEAGLGDGQTALDLLSDKKGELRGEPLRFSAALFVRAPLTLAGVHVLDDAPSKSRTLVAAVEGGKQTFTAASLAMPPGVTWHEGKTEQGDRVAAWLAARGNPVVVGMDRNGPKFEPLDGETEWWPRDSMELFGSDASHDLRDAYLAWLDQHPEERQFLGMVRPQGPLAVSFIRGKPPKVPGRYDAIYASSEFQVLDVRYVYEDAIRAGSDHGLVWAKLRLNGS